MLPFCRSAFKLHITFIDGAFLKFCVKQLKLVYCPSVCLSHVRYLRNGYTDWNQYWGEGGNVHACNEQHRPTSNLNEGLHTCERKCTIFFLRILTTFVRGISSDNYSTRGEGRGWKMIISFADPFSEPMQPSIPISVRIRLIIEYYHILNLLWNH